jgi:hypothetical protein
MGVVMDISRRVAVLNFGRKIARAISRGAADPRVKRAYLGQRTSSGRSGRNAGARGDHGMMDYAGRVARRYLSEAVAPQHTRTWRRDRAA